MKYSKPTSILSSIFDDKFFDDFYNHSLIKSIDCDIKTPIHDIIENDNEYQVEFSLAGVKKEDIKIDIEDDVLSIKAERKEVNDLKYNHKETYFGKYERLFTLSNNVDKDNIDATMVDGILKVIIPKLKNDTKLCKKTIEIK